MEVQTREVTLGDVVSIECANSQIVAKLKTLKLIKVQDAKQHRYVISILKIIEKIHEQYPSVEIQNMGAPDIIVTYEPMNKKNPFFHWMKVAVYLATPIFA